MAEVSCRRLVAHLDQLLDGQSGKDYCPNGLQLEGRESIHRIVSGVSACQRLFVQAIDLEADAVLVHHGLFWEGDDRRLVGFLKRRVELLLKAGINLIAYHLPLDRHPGLGNNTVAARRFGIETPRPFGEYDGVTIGFGGELETPISATDFGTRCGQVFGQPPLSFAHGPEPIRSAAFVSGAAERLLHQAIAQGYDAFVTGEVSEWVMNVARENNIHFFAAGHYATERLGIQELGRHVAKEFGIEVEFVDVPNPV